MRLAIGYTTHIGNKEIEVDSELSSKDMPGVTGTSIECENELDFTSSPPVLPVRGASSPVIMKVRRPSLEKTNDSSAMLEPSSSTAKRYVAPTSFYAQPAPKPKPKPKGPL